MDISNTQDIIDSRDIIERIEELEAEVLDDEEQTELATLKALIEDLSGNSGDSPEYGITLIHEHYFEDYAQELAEDIGAIPKDLTWPAYCIDWERAAHDLKMDYTSVEFDGETYYCR